MSDIKVHKIIVLLFLTAIPFSRVYSQFSENPFLFNEYTLDKGDLSLSVNGSGFFYNQEYFNPMVYSYTLAGYSLSPVVEYQVSKDIRIRGGIYGIKSLGRDEFSDLMPVFSFRYTPWKYFTIQFGTYDGGLSHRLPEQMYSYSQALFNSNEEGLQVMYNSEKMFFNVWLDWRHLTFPKDVDSERIFGGYSINYTLGAGKGSSLSLFTGMSVYHDGGQDLDISHTVTTFMNMSGGYHYEYQINDDISVGNKSYYIQFVNSIPRDDFAYIFGYGIASEFQAKWKFVSAKLGYWYGNRFYNPLGEFQFGSVSQKSLNILQPVRKVTYAHIDVQNQFYPGIILGMRSGFYLSKNLNTPDYYIGLLIKFDMDFLLLNHIKSNEL